ncbi:MAG: hypothetical protein R3E88_13345 [Myxococcota bacterium]
MFRPSGSPPTSTAATAAFLTSLALLGAACATSGSPAGERDAGAPPPDELAAALDELAASLERAEQSVRGAAAFGSDLERARGYEYLLRSMIQSFEAELLPDPDFPYFRVLDFRLRGGGDNPDQRYAFASIRGAVPYRVFGELGSARRLEVQLYSGEPWAGTGKSVGYLAFEQIALAPDGSFEIELVAPGTDVAAAPPGTTRIVSPPETTSVMVRHIFDVWDTRPTGGVHIDRIGYEGRRQPGRTSAEMAQRMRDAASDFEKRVATWPWFVEERYVKARPVNEVGELVDTYLLGGARGRWMGNAHFDLPPGKALVVRTWPTTAKYQAIQLTDLWFDSLEYGNQVSSLTSTQVVKAPDGAYYHVIAPEDPGYPNWLDTGGLTRGTMLLRFDGVQGEIPKALQPSAELVDLDALAEHIPGFATVTEAERARVRAARRHHLQIRSNR